MASRPRDGKPSDPSPLEETTMNSKRTLFLTLLAAASLPFLTTPSRAAPPMSAEEPTTLTVQFGDLNLRSREGIAQLYQRLAVAAGQVCGADSDTRSLANWSQVRFCTRQSMARAVAAVGIPELFAFYAQRTGHPLDSKILLTKR
jgi:UrcA family protein